MLNVLKNFMWEYRFIIVLLLTLIIYALLEKEKFKAKVYSLMLQAKSLAKDAILKSGDQQAEWVVKKAYQFLPRWITIFITEENMYKIVEYLYMKGKDYLDDGKLNNSIE